ALYSTKGEKLWKSCRTPDRVSRLRRFPWKSVNAYRIYWRIVNEEWKIMRIFGGYRNKLYFCKQKY
ncbi:MAG: hypothetical protein II453_13835, partial [Alphaproteobacteria bacterium]|nr:hypothetical protein [Alphaproteobacteria bacterium]